MINFEIYNYVVVVNCIACMFNCRIVTFFSSRTEISIIFLHIMRFHPSCHGNNIVLSEDGSQATRSKSYYHGITFSDKPQEPGQLVTVQLLEENKSWNGTLRYGLTNRDPGGIQPLPPFSVPDLTSQLGTWAKPLSEHHQNVGSRIGFCFNPDGSLSLYVNDECVETIDLCGAVDVTEPVWTLIDVYGSITSVCLLSLGMFNNSKAKK